MVRYAVCYILNCFPVSSWFHLRSILLRMAGVRIGARVSFCGHSWVYGKGQVSIGDETWISPRCTIYSHPLVPIRIGACCDVGPGVTFVTGSHNIGTSKRRAGNGKALAITVGNGCWIGAGVLILGGVTIGDGSVIAAGSVVTADVDANSLYAGVPAKFKRLLKDDV